MIEEVDQARLMKKEARADLNNAEIQTILLIPDQDRNYILENQTKQ